MALETVAWRCRLFSCIKDSTIACNSSSRLLPVLRGVVGDPDEGLLTTDVSEVDAQPPDMEELAKKMEQMSVTAMTAINRVAELSDTFVFYSTVPGTI